MTGFKYAIPAGCLALLMSSTVAMAQVTAQQVWDDWKAYLGVYGQDGVSIGAESYAGGVLTVSNIGYTMTEEGMTFGGMIDQMTLTEQGDGSVLVTMSDSYPITIRGIDSDGATIDFAMNMNQAGTTTVVTGAPGDMTYVISMPRLEMTVDRLVVDGEEMPLDMLIGASNIAGTYHSVTGADLRNMDYDLAVDGIDIKVSLAEPGTSNAFTLNGTIGGISGQTAMTLPADIANIDPEDILTSGFMIDSSQTMGAVQMSFNINADGETMQATANMAGGTAEVRFGGTDALRYGFAFQGLDIAALGSELPFPVAFSASELGMGFTMPMMASDAPQDFAGRISLSDIVLNEEIWRMFDPGAAIPRDPATLRLDVSGTATLLVDLTSPDIENMTEAPALLQSLAVNDVTLAIGGADAHATGSFTFDNSDMTTYPGMPRPTGKLDIALNGVNGLIEKLVQAGLVPAEQVMGMSMMLGMFSVPVGDDQLTSTIEFTADGGLLANGQRLQ